MRGKILRHIIYQVMCGRYIKGHMKLHSEQHGHPLVLSFSDLSVWCYGCESYIDAPVRCIFLSTCVSKYIF
jgi:Zn-finger in ubiquitin-hydrolases and other protein